MPLDTAPVRDGEFVLDVREFRGRGASFVLPFLPLLHADRPRFRAHLASCRGGPPPAHIRARAELVAKSSPSVEAAKHHTCAGFREDGRRCINMLPRDISLCAACRSRLPKKMLETGQRIARYLRKHPQDGAALKLRDVLVGQCAAHLQHEGA